MEAVQEQAGSIPGNQAKSECWKVLHVVEEQSGTEGKAAAALYAWSADVKQLRAEDMRPLKAKRCQYYSSGGSYIYENFYTSVSCWSPKESCSMTVRSGTCYCCDLYDCANGGYLSNYYEYVGVRSCEEVFTLYILIWTLSGLNLVAFFTGILTTAVLGSIKDLRSRSPATKPPESAASSSPTAPLLMDANTHTVHQLHPGASMYFPTAEGTAASQSFPSSSTPHTESNPPPFVPLTSLLPYRVHGIRA